MKRLLDIASWILFWPVWLVAGLVPKRPDLWVFGAWHGAAYSDNSRALFEYILKRNPEIDAVWSTKNPEVYETLKEDGLPVVYSYSPKGFWLNMRAHTVVVTSGLVDINRFSGKARRVVQLYHGAPLKRIGDDSRRGLSLLTYRALRRIFPHVDYPYDYFISTSERVTRTYRSAFPRVKEFVVTGFPRNDLLVRNARAAKPRPLILHMPTFRGNGDEIATLFQDFDPRALDQLLKRAGFSMVIKLHPILRKPDLLPSGVDNITFAEPGEDAYELLSQSAMLITDYSSVYFDFLLLDRPILFFSSDIDAYASKDRGFYYDYDEVTPGPKCLNWKEIAHELEKILGGCDDFADERHRVRKMFHRYTDDQSCQRLCDLLMAQEAAGKNNSNAAS